MTFPMISICNYNVFATQYAQEFLLNELNQSVYLTDADRAIIFNESATAAQKVNIYFDRYYEVFFPVLAKMADASVDESVKRQFGMTKEQMFIDASWGASTDVDFIARDEFVRDYVKWYYDPSMGNCFKINSGLAENGSA